MASPFLTQPGMLANQRQAELAQALMQRGMSGAAGQMVGNHYVSNALPNAIQAISGALLSRKTSDDATKLQEGQQKQMADQIKQYMAMRQGGLSADGMGPEASPNPQGAQTFALSSQNPLLQQMGMKEFEHGLKQDTALTPKDILNLGDFDPQSRLAAALGGGMGKLAPKTEKPVVVEGQLVDPSTGKPVADLRETYNQPETIGGDLYQRPTREGGLLKKLDNAPKITNNVRGGNTLVQGQKAGMEKWAELAGKTVSDLSEQARGAQKTLRSVGQLEQLNRAGVPGGPAANAGVFLQNLAQQFGVPVDKNRLANAQEFNSISGQVWLDVMNSVGGARGLVKEESERIQRDLPSLLQSPQGRQQVIDFLKANSQATIGDAREAQKQYSGALQSSDPSGFTFGLSNTMTPQTPNDLSIKRPSDGAGAGGPRVKNW